MRCFDSLAVELFELIWSELLCDGLLVESTEDVPCSEERAHALLQNLRSFV